MANHSSILAWRIPWTEEPGGLQSGGCCKELDTTEHAFPNKIKSNLFFPCVFGLVPRVYRVLSEVSHLALQTRVPCRKRWHGHQHLRWTSPAQKLSTDTHDGSCEPCAETLHPRCHVKRERHTCARPSRSSAPQPSKAAPPTTCLGSVCARAQAHTSPFSKNKSFLCF